MEGHLSTVCALILILGVVGYSDASVKPGSCPQFQGPTNSRGFLWQCKSWPGCSNDNNCPGQLKCCRRGCASVCVAPVIVVVRVKPGSCPQIHGSSNSGGSLRPSPVCKSWPGCSNDNNCPGQLKCCRRGCASVCVAPVRVVVRVKPGSCPQVHGSSSSRGFTWPSVCKSWPGCSNDYDCPGRHKCCRRGCRSVCLAPAIKPLSCPPIRWNGDQVCAFGSQRRQCSTDKPCPRGFACCKRQCGQVCTRLRSIWND